MSAKLQDFNQRGITGKCTGRLECKIDLPGDNNPCTITQATKEGSNDYGHFNLDSNLYTNFKYGGKLYIVNSCYFTCGSITLDNSIKDDNGDPDIPSLITSFYDTSIIGQIIIKFTEKGKTEKILNLIIPIYSGNINNNVGNYLLSSIAKLSNPGQKSTLKLNNIIPKKTEFYHLKTASGSGTNETTYDNIIFSGSKIIVQESTYVLIWWNGGTWSETDSYDDPALNVPDDSIKKTPYANPAGSDYTTTLRESTVSDDNIAVPAVEATGEPAIPAALKNTAGIVSTLHGTSIINCAPVDDNGMLLTDREKGLGNEGITKTTSMESLTRKYTQGTMAQMLIGAVLLFFLTKMVRSTLSLLDKK